MEPTPIFYNPEKFFETNTGNKLGKKCIIRGPDQIQLSGKSIFHNACIIRGDLARISLGKYVIMKEGCIVKPSYEKGPGQIKFVPMSIGDHVMIGSSTILCAAKIGSNVQIGKNCVISHRVMIGDNVKILDDSYLPPDTNVPPFTVYGGKPAHFIAELPESAGLIHQEEISSYYNSFIREKPDASPTSSSSVK